MEKPLVSILIPVYNSEKFIIEAINSIITQTYNKLEIIIINDGSTDNTSEKINSIKDHRIQFIQNTENLGLIKTLNKGLKLCNGDYIARMDADDIAISDRIEKQIYFLEKNPDYGLCATRYETFDGSNVTNANEVENYDIKLKLLHQCHICHPSVILRKSIVEKYNLKYSSSFPHAEDYALWVEMSDKTKFHTCPEILLKYRNHDSNISKLESSTQEERSIEVKKYYFNKLGCPMDTEEIFLYTRFAYSDFSISIGEMKKIDIIIRKLLTEHNHNIIPLYKMNNYFSGMWNALITNTECPNKQALKIHSKSYIAIHIFFR